MTPVAEARLGNRISRFPHLQTSGDYGVDDFLPGLLANYEMTQRSNPALSKPVTRKMPSKAA
jgi:hypothetical protein